MKDLAKFVPNPKAIEFLKRDRKLAEALEHIANEIVTTAKETAPVETGAYRDKIEANSGVIDGEVAAVVNAFDWKSGFIEFGTGEPAPTPAYAVLQRAVEANGLRLTPDSGEE